MLKTQTCFVGTKREISPSYSDPFSSCPFFCWQLSPETCQPDNNWIHMYNFHPTISSIIDTPCQQTLIHFIPCPCQPSQFRLNKDVSGGAWCPFPQVDSELSGSEWIQVNLTKRFVITAIETLGRFGNGMGVEFVEEFWVEYSRDFGSTWIKWRNKKGAHLLHGNINTFDVKRNVFDVPIVGANMVRIVPFSQYLRTVCLRFELFGCPFEGTFTFRVIFF